MGASSIVIFIGASCICPVAQWASTGLYRTVYGSVYRLWAISLWSSTNHVLCYRNRIIYFHDYQTHHVFVAVFLRDSHLPRITALMRCLIIFEIFFDNTTPMVTCNLLLFLPYNKINRWWFRS
jgi:hypothetical protein